MRKYLKNISLMLVVLMFFTSIPLQNIVAAGTLSIVATDVEAVINSDESVEIPFSVKNNQGLMGLGLTVTYDADTFENPVVTKGDVLSVGTFNDSINDNTNGIFVVLWSGTSEVTTDGELFKISFSVKSTAKTGEYEIKLSNKDGDTFDESFTDVTPVFQNPSVLLKLEDGTSDPKPSDAPEETEEQYIVRIKQDNITALKEYAADLCVKANDEQTVSINSILLNAVTEISAINKVQDVNRIYGIRNQAEFDMDAVFEQTGTKPEDTDIAEFKIEKCNELDSDFEMFDSLYEFTEAQKAEVKNIINRAKAEINAVQDGDEAISIIYDIYFAAYEEMSDLSNEYQVVNMRARMIEEIADYKGYCVEECDEDAKAQLDEIEKRVVAQLKACDNVSDMYDILFAGYSDMDAVCEGTYDPNVEPTAKPTAEPTAKPTAEPTAKPTAEPTAKPTAEPTAKPTAEPTAEPTDEPVVEPTAKPTADPTNTPVITATPTPNPTQAPATVGMKLKNDYTGVTFNVTSVTGVPTVTVSSVPMNKKVEILDEITYMGKTYKVTAIDPMAFSGNTSVETVAISNNIQALPSRAFADCTNLKSINLGNGVTNITKDMFAGCNNLEQLNIGDGVQSIPNQIFKNHSKLRSVTIGKNVTSIGTDAFSGCSKLTFVTIDKSGKLKTVGDKAFYGCKNLISIQLSAKLTKIGKSAFQKCKKLNDITIYSKKLKANSVGSNAFKGINKFAEITVPKSKVKTYTSIFKTKGFNGKNQTVVK